MRKRKDCLVKRSILFFLIIIPFKAFADPIPFGIQVGKTTLDEIKSKFKVTTTGARTKCSGNQTYQIDATQVNGAYGVSISIDSDGIAHSLSTRFPKKNYVKALALFSEKYHLDLSRFPKKGKTSIRFSDGHTEIDWKARYQFLEFTYYKGLCHHSH